MAHSSSIKGLNGSAAIARIGLLLVIMLPALARADAEYSEKGADTCLLCHRDAVTLAIFDGPHGRPDVAPGPFGSGQLQCEACHGPGRRHSIRADREDPHPDILRFGKTSASPVNLRNAVCIECHAAAPTLNWIGSAHDTADVACADCHVSHAGRDMSDILNTPSTCLDCHPRQAMAAKMLYTHPTATGAMNCGDCHAPHGASGEFQLKRNTVNETCYACHADKRGPVLWEHAPVTEDCSTCHDSHGSNHPAMLTQRGPYLCQTCHSQSGHPSVAFDGAGLADGQSPSVFLVGSNCLNCHSRIHGSNHPSGAKFMR